jgi:hypothetical protein
MEGRVRHAQERKADQRQREGQQISTPNVGCPKRQETSCRSCQQIGQRGLNTGAGEDPETKCQRDWKQRAVHERVQQMRPSYSVGWTLHKRNVSRRAEHNPNSTWTANLKPCYRLCLQATTHCEPRLHDMKLNRHFLSGIGCGVLLTGGLSYY